MILTGKSYKKNVLSVILLLLFVVGAQATPEIKDQELKSLIWHKWDTRDFIILSLDDGQGKYLQNNIGHMKKWVLTRWGLPDFKFAADCRVLCVPNKILMKKLFRLDSSCAEIQKKNGKIELSILWLVLDESPAETIPNALTIVCLNEYQQIANVKLGFWAQRGMGVLNGTIRQIKQDFKFMYGVVKQDKKMYLSSIFSVTEEQWKNKTSEEQLLFDREAAIVCLFLRKEYGQTMFLKFITSPATERELKSVYGFSNIDEYNAILVRYMRYLLEDVNSNKTPDNYLQITCPKGK
jgi:hypothetical protein